VLTKQNDKMKENDQKQKEINQDNQHNQTHSRW